MEAEILDALEDLKYEGQLTTNESLLEIVEGPGNGPKNLDYTKLIAWLSEELRGLLQLEECVGKTASSEDHASFCMEVSSFLKEMGCPHTLLMEGSATDRLSSNFARLLLIHYLAVELMAARMTLTNHPQTGIKVKMTESSEAKDLKELLVTLGFPKPPANITAQQLFAKANQKVNEVKSKVAPSLIGKPLFTDKLTDKQWSMLQEMQKEMDQEYTMRREMMLQRLDLTIQSFQWSDQAKARADHLTAAFRVRRDKMKVSPDVSIGHLVAARDDLAKLEKTSNASVRKNTQTPLNKVLIGRVPDRGGRAHEHEPPPPEMPSWTQRSSGGGGKSSFTQPEGSNRDTIEKGHGGGGRGGFGGGGRGGFGGGGRGGGGRGGNSHGGGGNFSNNRVQGAGWNQDSGRGGGGYSNNRGNLSKI